MGDQAPEPRIGSSAGIRHEAFAKEQAMRRVSAIVGAVLLLVLMLPAAAIAAAPGDEPDTAIPVSAGEAMYN